MNNPVSGESSARGYFSLILRLTGQTWQSAAPELWERLEFGWARPGMAVRGKAGLGMAGLGIWPGGAGHVRAWQGGAGQGIWLGEAWRGGAWRGWARNMARRGTAWPGAARLGKARNKGGHIRKNNKPTTTQWNKHTATQL